MVFGADILATGNAKHFPRIDGLDIRPFRPTWRSASDTSGRQAMAIIRKLVLLAFLIAGGVLCFYHRRVIAVAFVDFPEVYKQVTHWERTPHYELRPKGPGQPPELVERGEPPKALVDKFIEDRMKLGLIKVEGPEWEEVFTAARLASPNLDDLPPRWLKRAAACAFENGPGRWSQHACGLYFRPHESPLNEIAPKLLDKQNFTYVTLRRNGNSEYLAVSSELRWSDPPWALAHPYSRYVCCVLLGGFALIALLPWPRPSAGSLHFPCLKDARASAFQWRGGCLIGLAYWLPAILLGNPNSWPGYPGLDRSLDLLGFAATLWSLMVISWYQGTLGASSLQVQILADRLRATTVWGRTDWFFSTIRSVWPAHVRRYSARHKATPPNPPDQPGQATPTPQVPQPSDPTDIELRFTNDACIGLSGLVGIRRLLKVLRDARMHMSPDLEPLLQPSDEPEPPVPSTLRPRLLAIASLSLLALPWAVRVLLS